MDDSVKSRALIEIRRILEIAGYDIEEEGDPFDLSAFFGDDCILILVSDDQACARTFDKKQYNLEENGEKIPCRKLIVTMNEQIRPADSALWTFDDLRQLAGEAAIARITEKPLLIQWETTRGNQREIQKPTQTPGQITSLPVRVSMQEAIRISGEKGKTSLRLIPHWAYRYSCSGDAAYKGKQISFDAEGAGVISAINGLPQDVNPDEAKESEIPTDSELVRPSITANEAEEKIISALIATLSKRVRIKTESGDAIFSEEKTFKPSREQIERVFWLMYVPIWQIRGRQIVEVNAYTGEILSEPMDEGVELL
ncbi:MULTISPECIES: hypothetical protein [Methanocalculus]|uniref:hypothetical protein n=1 Tax=Methanocalculus TaxID=71151 RepID=UPI0020A1E6A9|nr:MULTISPECIES: hypothetical protein [unclassified Methanocalculus]MCP1661340.1 hypothetical protein [Methanocalculus sp. AMF5]